MVNFKKRKLHFHSILELRGSLLIQKNGPKHEERAQFLLQNCARLNENKHSSFFQESVIGIKRFWYHFPAILEKINV